MVVNIIIAVSALLVGLICGRILTILGKRGKWHKQDSAVVSPFLKRRAIIPQLLLSLLFIVGVVVVRESFITLLRYYLLCSIAYIVIVNIVFVVQHIKAKSGLSIWITAVLGRIFSLSGIVVFCYYLFLAIVA